MSQEREPIAWITRGGKHIPIFAQDPSDDEKAKDRQIADNQRQADTKNDRVADYSKFDSPQDMAFELYKRTGINMTGRLNSLDDSTCAQVCSTLEDLQNKYHINAASDPEDTENDRLEVNVPSYYDHQFEGENENDFANAVLCKIRLNSKYYSLPYNELDEIYQEGTETQFHPTGTSAKDVIAHEAAHHMLDAYVWEHCGHRFDKYSECQNWLVSGEYHNPQNPNKTVYDLDNKFKRCAEKLNENPEFIKLWGGLPHLSVTALASPEYNTKKWAISGYAAKNRHELVAEAFTDFYANGKNAKEYSKIIVFEIFGLK